MAKGGRQSTNSALPFTPQAETSWSMMPQGVLQKVCSHFWQRSALSCKGGERPGRNVCKRREGRVKGGRGKGGEGGLGGRRGGTREGRGSGEVGGRGEGSGRDQESGRGWKSIEKERRGVHTSRGGRGEVRRGWQCREGGLSVRRTPWVESAASKGPLSWWQWPLRARQTKRVPLQEAHWRPLPRRNRCRRAHPAGTASPHLA